MALEESVENLEKMMINSINIYIDSQLKSFLEQNGKINIDFKEYPTGGGGYLITVGEQSAYNGCGSS